MSNHHETILADLKARQLGRGAHEVPRCGLSTMKPALHTNALSRHADIYVCDGCGMEGGRLYLRAPRCQWQLLGALQPNNRL